jgi:hypothetical protein
MLTERDQAVLAHIGRYRVTLREVLRRVFNLPSPGNLTQRLRAQGYIRERRTLEGRLSYYQLTEAGALDRVPLDRAKAFKPRALAQHLAVLCYCHLDGVRRERLEEAELDELHGAVTPSARHVPYCLELGPDRRRLYRVFVPGPNIQPLRFVKSLRAACHTSRSAAGDLPRALAARAFGFAVLADTAPRQVALRDAIRASRLLEQAHIVVHHAPGPTTIMSYLRSREASRA